MYVRKFEADSIDEALKNIKAELGPDAIILKTVTNKGLKGAFRKKKIEITAAISEKNYTKKARVDNVLDEGQKRDFYSSPAEFVNNMLDSYSGERKTSAGSYGKMGLNRSVRTKEESSSFSTGLDAFLNDDKRKQARETEIRTSSSVEEIWEEAPVVEYPSPRNEVPVETNWQQSLSDREIGDQTRRIEELEAKVFELGKLLEGFTKEEPAGLKQLASSLRSLDIEEAFIQGLIRKSRFEMSDEELNDTDHVFEFALREMIGRIKTGFPGFSKGDCRSPITILVSESSCGQSSTLVKLASLVENAQIISMKDDCEEQNTESFALKMFGYEYKQASGVPELVSYIRTATEQEKVIFIDIKSRADRPDETKSIVDSLKRTFGNVELLVCLSALHTELYNKKTMGRYRTMADGVVVTHVDQCLNFGSLFNIANDFQNMPFKFFGTGEVVPDDIEAATPERILDGIFQLS